MKGRCKRILYGVREFLVILYEISLLLLPITSYYLFYSTGMPPAGVVIAILLYLLPYLIHAGVFGDGPKLAVDKILGYEEFKA